MTGDILRANRSPITFPVARRVNLTNIRNLVKHDQSRAKLLKAHGAAKASGLIVRSGVISSPAENQAVSYVASVGIGIPATDCKWQLNSPLNVFLFHGVLEIIDSLLIDTSRCVIQYLSLQGLKIFESSFIVIDTTNKPYVKTGTSVAEPGTVVY